IIGGRYKILDLIGHGGMGSVYRVEQVQLGKIYALKTLKADSISDVTWRRFQNEAKAASRLEHANLVKAYDFGLIDERQPYFVMDLVEGESLADRLKRTGPLTVPEALALFIPLCFALDYAHKEGIVHRDLKPSNIVLAKKEGKHDLEPKIVDFGIAKIIQTVDGTADALTKTGDVFGTPSYMSPEQCTGGAIDYRTDIYSMGCVMFEALTGSPPFHGESAVALLGQHVGVEPPTLKEASLGKEFPQGLEQI